MIGMIDLSVCQNSERFAFDIRCLRGRVDRNGRLSICQHCSFHARLQDEDDKEDDKEDNEEDDKDDDEAFRLTRPREWRLRLGN